MLHAVREDVVTAKPVVFTTPSVKMRDDERERKRGEEKSMNEAR